MDATDIYSVLSPDIRWKRIVDANIIYNETKSILQIIEKILNGEGDIGGIFIIDKCYHLNIPYIQKRLQSRGVNTIEATFEEFNNVRNRKSV
jgi:hypothetical protein